MMYLIIALLILILAVLIYFNLRMEAEYKKITTEYLSLKKDIMAPEKYRDFLKNVEANLEARIVSDAEKGAPIDETKKAALRAVEEELKNLPS